VREVDTIILDLDRYVCLNSDCADIYDAIRESCERVPDVYQEDGVIGCVAFRYGITERAVEWIVEGLI